MTGIKSTPIGHIIGVRASYEEFRIFQEGLESEQSLHVHLSSQLHLTGLVGFASITLVKVHDGTSLLGFSFHRSRDRGQGNKYDKCRDHGGARNPT
jgi:hypothetical protein